MFVDIVFGSSHILMRDICNFPNVYIIPTTSKFGIFMFYQKIKNFSHFILCLIFHLSNLQIY